MRATREYAGLPPSGAAPPGFFVTTTVKAVRLRTLPTEDDTLVQEVWMVYDRHGPGSGGGPDKNPLTDQMDSIVLVWEDGDWKLTEEYDSLKNYPIVPYDPDSPKAWQHGWWQVDR
ncbi:hypothetical protein [Streptomyces sodiiphilus]|uniref:hypothetical protein n=1 Tax=Streptomyces sodiiphilus TaxID=226217 RepID=UPI0031D4D74D